MLTTRTYEDAILELLPDTHPALRRAIPETNVDAIDARGVAGVLERSMTAADGIGLAANQVGLDVRAFAMRRLDGTVLTLFNPRVEVDDGELRAGGERCLSFPGLELEIERRRAIRLTWTDSGGGPHDEWLRGLEAIIAQHEVDHLDGIVFTSKVSRLVLERAKKRLAKESRRDIRAR